MRPGSESLKIPRRLITTDSGEFIYPASFLGVTFDTSHSPRVVQPRLHVSTNTHCQVTWMVCYCVLRYFGIYESLQSNSTSLEAHLPLSFTAKESHNRNQNLSNVESMRFENILRQLTAGKWYFVCFFSLIYWIPLLSTPVRGSQGFLCESIRKEYGTLGEKTENRARFQGTYLLPACMLKM